MATFGFRFQSILQHRLSVENDRQRRLAHHTLARMILHDQLRHMQNTIRHSKHQLGDGLRGKVDLEAVFGFARYNVQVAQRARLIVLRLAALEKQIEVARHELLEAVRQRRSIELLRDKHFERWQREQNRRENIELDEIANQQYLQATTRRREEAAA